MNKIAHTWYERLIDGRPEDLSALREEISRVGYSAFRNLLEELRIKLVEADEPQLKELERRLHVARQAVPEPGKLSPSWETIWDDYAKYIRYKAEVFRAIPPEDRDGEWQVIMDNPYTTEPVACYPGLAFVEAAYLYAYFRKGLAKNEHLRLQKVTNCLTATGDDA